MIKLAGLAFVFILACIVLAGIWMVSYVHIGIGNETYRMLSGSMRPTIPEGAIIVVETGVNPDEIVAEDETGDVILFHKPTNYDEFIVHRAIGKTWDGDAWFFKTKGDANNSPDYWSVPETYIVGKVTEVNSFPAIIFAMSLFWFATIIGLAAGSVVLFVLSRERRPKQEPAKPIPKEGRTAPQPTMFFCRYCGAENKGRESLKSFRIHEFCG